MFHIGLKRKNRYLHSLAAVCACAIMLIAVEPEQAATPTVPLSLDLGFHQMYNLDFAGAHRTFEAWKARYPEDPLGAASNAAAYLFSEFERMRILELDLFTDNKRFEQRDKVAPDPEIRNAFERELSKADTIAAKILSQSGEDKDALFARVLTDGLRGDYSALIERKKLEGLGYLKSSRTTAEKLLNLDPNYHDAYLALGIENYVLGLRSAPTRWMLRLSGAQASKEKGIANLKITAEKGRYLRPYASLLLAIAALRDQDTDRARKILNNLAQEFPRNHLYQVELRRLGN
ncbi:MAG TPA: hypothetical protein VFY29_19975 [Terriglobia bacterium]|nr:hypothetical protein [Terriglobia bacterium]